MQTPSSSLPATPVGRWQREALTEGPWRQPAPPPLPSAAVPLPTSCACREELRQCQQSLRLGTIPVHLRRQRLQAIELRLGPDEMVKRDLDPLAIKVTVEIEQMCFQQLLRRVEHRAGAEVGDAGILMLIVDPHAHRVNAVGG